MPESPFSRISSLFRSKKRIWILALFFAALLLLFITPTEHTEEANTHFFDEKAYVKQLESRTQALLSNVQGAGEVRVMISIDNFYREEYATDRTQEETKSESASDTSAKESVVLQTEKNGVKSPVVQSVYLPRVRGVSVVCSGGADPNVQMKILSQLMALFDLDATQISVTN